MGHHRAALPAITRDADGTHIAIDVSEAAESEAPSGSLGVAARSNLIEGISCLGDPGHGGGHRCAQLPCECGHGGACLVTGRDPSG